MNSVKVQEILYLERILGQILRNYNFFEQAAK